MLAVLAASPPAAGDPAPTFNPPKSYLLALGDSVGYGFQSSKFAAGLPPSGFATGYVDVFSTRLRAVRPGLKVVNFSCPGETTSSFSTGPCLFSSLGFALHDHFEGSQLSAALAFLRAHEGQVSPVTLTLWGGDVREFVQSCGGDLECVSNAAPAEIARIAVRLGSIVAQLRAAAPNAEIIVTGPWNTFIGTFPVTDPLFFALGSAMAAAVSAERARYADMLPVFNPQGDLALETATICSLTLLCTEGDSHPSDAGYRAIADLVFEASAYARLEG
jgi:lysophospholipase L1-like esterase